MERAIPIIRKRQPAVANEALQKVSEMLKAVRFGSVTIVIQDGQVLQIEKTEKFRLTHGR